MLHSLPAAVDCRRTIARTYRRAAFERRDFNDSVNKFDVNAYVFVSQRVRENDSFRVFACSDRTHNDFRTLNCYAIETSVKSIFFFYTTRLKTNLRE